MTMTRPCLSPVAEESLRTRDARLVERVKAGEPDLFHDLIRPYERGLYLIAYSILRNVEDAEDIAQEAVLKALTRLNQLQSSEKFRQWLFRIVVNEARMRRRKYRRTKCESIDEERRRDEKGDAIRFDFPDSRPLQSEVLQARDVQTAVRRAIGRLPQEYREACILRDVEQLRLDEIMDVLSISLSAAKSRCHRARMRLRDSLEGLLL